METYFNNDSYTSSERLKASLGAVRNNSESLLSNFSNIADSHFELLNEETTEQKADLVKGLVSFISASLILATALICVSLSLAALLAESFASLSLSGALAIVSGIWLIGALGAMYYAYQLLSGLSVLPTATIQSIRETIKCLKN